MNQRLSSLFPALTTRIGTEDEAGKGSIRRIDAGFGNPEETERGQTANFQR